MLFKEKQLGSMRSRYILCEKLVATPFNSNEWLKRLFKRNIIYIM